MPNTTSDTMNMYCVENRFFKIEIPMNLKEQNPLLGS